jgi:glycosyltransferase involved in cell wall biosynthesis
MKLSYILPCYNVEKYIGECLQSIYSQNIDENDFEVICVNDCSPDNTSKIILGWQKTHKNLILIEHEVNKMQGGARNTGLRTAKGKYVWFIDPDDYIKPDCVKSILQTIEENNLDFLFFDYEKVDENGNFIERKFHDFSTEICEGKTVFRQEGWYWITMYIWAKVAKRSFYLENNLFFYENFHDEDYVNGANCFRLAKRVKYFAEACVCYRQREGSDMSMRETGKAYASRFKLCVELYRLSLEEKDEFVYRSFLSIVNFYAVNKSIFKRILYLLPYQRRLFYKKIQLIDDINLIEPFLDFKMKFAVHSKIGMEILWALTFFPHKIVQKTRKYFTQILKK